MFLTITPDPVLDKILLIDEWTPGVPTHAAGSTTSVGGKGLDSSVVFRHLGLATMGLAFLAGPTGRELAQLVEGYGIDLQATWCRGETRTATIIAESRHHRHTHIFSGGPQIDESHLHSFDQRFRAVLPRASWLICGGVVPAVLPAGFYRPIIEASLAAGVPVLIDTQKEFLLEALPAKPTIVKMNWRELEWTFQGSASNLEEVQALAYQVWHGHRLNALVVTCGAQGILAITPEGSFHAIPPVLAVVNAAGAGDAASAALAWRFSRGDSWPEALQWAAAVSAAVVLTDGTADCRMEDIEKIYPEVAVQVLPNPSIAN